MKKGLYLMFVATLLIAIGSTACSNGDATTKDQDENLPDGLEQTDNPAKDYAAKDNPDLTGEIVVWVPFDTSTVEALLETLGK